MKLDPCTDIPIDSSQKFQNLSDLAPLWPACHSVSLSVIVWLEEARVPRRGIYPNPRVFAGISDLASNLATLASNGPYLGLIKISVMMNRKLILKSQTFVPFGVNLPNLIPNLTSLSLWQQSF